MTLQLAEVFLSLYWTFVFDLLKNLSEESRVCSSFPSEVSSK